MSSATRHDRPPAEQLEAFWDLSHDLLAIADFDGNFLALNDAWEATLGWSKTELCSVPYAEFVHPDDIDRTSGEADAMASRGRDSLSFENRYRAKSGEYRHLLWTAKAAVSEGLIYAVARDVTGERRARHEADELSARADSILAAAGEAIFGIDRSGDITFVNPAAASMLGSNPPAVVGEHLHHRVHRPGEASEPPSWEACPVKATLADGHARRIANERLRRRDGSVIPVDYHASAIVQDSEIVGAVVTATDISVRMRAEDQLRRASDLADAASRAKSQFLSHMSHELRTPLNAILGFTQLLEMRPLGEDERQELHHIRRAGEHLLDLINQMLDIARIEAGRLPLSLEPVEAETVINDAVALIRPACDQRRITPGVMAPGDLFVLADRQRLQQVLLNLLSNAVKYNHHGGSLTVAARPDPDDEATVLIDVTDTGPGIASDRLERLFVPFERLEDDWDATEGAGLGLPLSGGLVEAMGGSIRVESEVGSGSTFTVSLPRTSGLPTTTNVRRAAALPGAPSNGIARVLYIEDNLANLRLIESVAALRPGVELVSALQGRLGIELARQHLPDLILLDLHLPDMGGEDVLRDLQGHERTARCDVVVISADATPGRIRRLLDMGAVDYLTKPIDVPRLVALLDRSLAASGDG